MRNQVAGPRYGYGGLPPVPTVVVVVVILIIAGALTAAGHTPAGVAAVLAVAGLAAVEIVGRLNAVGGARRGSRR